MTTDKKLRIMQAAERLFTTRQFHEITLDQVARRANVGKGTIYLYFQDKEDLFFQTAVAGFDDMCQLLHDGAVQGAAFREEILGTCRQINDFFLKRRPLFRMIAAEGDRVLGRGGSLRDRWLQRRKRLTEALAAILTRGMAAGDVRSDIPAEIMAEYLLGMLRARATELEGGPSPCGAIPCSSTCSPRGPAAPSAPTKR